MHARNFSSHEIPFSQLSAPLSVSAITGDLSRAVGLIPLRRIQPSAATTSQRDPRHVAFVHPPLPSERRAAPRRPDAKA